VTAVGDRVGGDTVEALAALKEKLATEPRPRPPVPPVLFLAPKERDGQDETEDRC
jgi:hypothetical protein